MIFGCLLAASIFPGRFVELPMPTADRVSIAIVAPIVKLGAHDRAVVDILCKVLLQGCDLFSKEDIRNLTLGAGTRPECFSMPDHIRLQLDVPPALWKQGLLLAKSLTEHANLSDSSVNDALQTVPYVKRNYWQVALRPMRDDFLKVTPKEVRDAYSYIFRPENLSIAVSGPLPDGTARDYWAGMYQSWQPTWRPRPLPGVGPEIGPDNSGQPISTCELAGQVYSASNADFPARVLATFALGVGKESAAFRIIRDKLGFSYRQEAFLWPVPGGFQPRIIFASKPTDDDVSKALRAKEALLADIPTWSEEERLRDLAMARSVFLRGLPLDPILVQPGGLRESQDDRTFMTAYWFPKTGQYWSESDLLKSLEAVNLDSLKKAALDIVRGSSCEYVSGR